jgi:glutaredoxin
MSRSLIMYSRTTGCPYIGLAKRILDDYGVPYREIFIDQDRDARQRVLTWTGFLSVPTLIAAENGSVLPYSEPSPLVPATSPRGINRGAMITEPNSEQLIAWLKQEGFLSAEVDDSQLAVGL